MRHLRARVHKNLEGGQAGRWSELCTGEKNEGDITAEQRAVLRNRVALNSTRVNTGQVLNQFLDIISTQWWLLSSFLGL